MAAVRRSITVAAMLLAYALLTNAFAPRAALAHPLGNFTVNHYTRIEISGDTFAVRYVLDMAEIPSVQETRAADTNGDGTVSVDEWDAYKERKAAEIASQIQLRIDNQTVALVPTEVSLSRPLGQGDIPLVRLEMWLHPTTPVTPNVAHQAILRDRSDPTRIGWREVVVHAGSGADVSESDVPTQDVSDELRSYPDDLLQNPLDRREAHWTFRTDGSASSTNARTDVNQPSRPPDPFAALVTTADLNPAVILLASLAAAVLGGIHAASPGHGKSIMAAYIVGRRGTILHASALAISVTLSHTTGVLVLGVLTLLASNLIVPDRLYPWLTLVSGALVLVVGARFLISAWRGRNNADSEHEHDHEHVHVHPQPGDSKRLFGPTWRGLFALGLAGGIVPSGSALVVLLSSLALGRLGFGLILIVAFGFGMAVVLVTAGVLFVHAGRLMVRVVPATNQRRISRVVPLVSACVMTLLGVAATFEGLSQTGLLGS